MLAEQRTDHLPATHHHTSHQHPLDAVLTDTLLGALAITDNLERLP
ncbi:MAG: hypothetical protein K6T90_21550 [Leptolyngbyaceae cyanobacterium HOT.MB2.61]|nr:hypothetical protein [Leptolyngbyaceae cyanobacterium HOT.MB2.61]